MNSSSSKNIFLLISLSIYLSVVVSAQNSIAEIKHKKCLLKGKWQLVRTLSDSVLDSIDKEEYDHEVRLKPFHKYTEEVHYEGYHWKIEGRWQVYKHKATLALTERKYVLGNLGDVPQDIFFELSELTKQNWTGNSTAKDKPVKMFYRRITRR